MSCGTAAPIVGQNNFFREIEQFFGQRPKKMKNNILKIINEKYEKYSIGYSKIECSKSEHFGVRHSDWKSCLITSQLDLLHGSDK